MLMFGRNVKFYRMKNMMTQEELAEKSESSPVCISNYENGVNFPSARTMVLLAHALNVSVFMLFVDGDRNTGKKKARKLKISVHKHNGWMEVAGIEPASM